MATRIRPTRVNHANVVVEDFAASVARLAALYDAQLILEMPQKEWHAGLVEVGGVIIELFAPYDFLLAARQGPFHLGIEYRADMSEVRAAIAERGIRIVRDIGLAVHTHPADTLGIAFEFYDGEFHERDYPLIGGRLRSAEHWRAHPLGLTGLVGFVLCVGDIESTARFLEDFVSAERLGPSCLRVADATIELIAGTDGLHSTIFGVEDLARTEAELARRGLTLVPGSAAGRLATPPADNLGLIFEFAEQ